MTAAGRRPDAVARDALVRIERDGAYANLVVPSLLDRSQPERRATGPS